MRRIYKLLILHSIRNLIICTKGYQCQTLFGHNDKVTF